MVLLGWLIYLGATGVVANTSLIPKHVEEGNAMVDFMWLRCHREARGDIAEKLLCDKARDGSLRPKAK